MKERPILFTGPMVRAILDGRKTQTRRAAKPGDFGAGSLDQLPADVGAAFARFARPRHPRYGEAGDRLWVRESWRYYDWTDDGLPWVQYAADDARRLCERIPAKRQDRVEGEWATLSDPANYAIDGKAADRKWRPSIFMPRWASRLALAVTAVRVERLQAISEDDARAEGVDRYAAACDHPRFGCDEIDCLGLTHRASYAALWDDINGDRAPWASNPWVWVIEFKRATEGATAP